VLYARFAGAMPWARSQLTATQGAMHPATQNVGSSCVT
jgi:hypothetical protein